MKNASSSILALLAAGSFAFAQGPPPPASPLPRATPSMAAMVISFQGRVEVLPAGTATWNPAVPRQVLNAGDQVRTPPDSRALLELPGEGTLRLRGSSQLAFRAPPQPRERPIVEVFRGFFHFLNRGKTTETEVIRGLTVAGTRGTEFQVAVTDDGELELTVLEGEVDLRNPQGAVALKSGERGTTRPAAPPVVTTVLEAVNVIQWCLHYPVVLDVDELGIATDESEALSASLEAFRSGRVLDALELYPAGRTPVSEGDRVYRATLALAVGEVEMAERLLAGPGPRSRLAESVLELIAAVKGQAWTRPDSPGLATEWLAESYYLQSQAGRREGGLVEALQAAEAAVERSPRCGWAWARAAELRFSLGRTTATARALEQALLHSPDNAQAAVLRGFVASSENRMTAALAEFDHAIRLDGALADAWLGRGLCRIRRGQSEEGRRDLLIAAALEPRRAVLRSYLGKAYSEIGDESRAERELDLARQLDPRDPTSWLYLALEKQQRNRLNEAVRDLERSKAENDNRRLFRSEMLLDQDRAVRSANLARIYQEAGLPEVAFREAVQAVAADYGNYSAHLFLANSYDQLRDPNLFNLRYETAANSEYLLANLLAPAEAGTLSPAVSQQEYSKLFQRDRLGLHSTTEYLSRGAWTESAAQFGQFGKVSYSLEAFYRTDPGQAPNADVEQKFFTASVKGQLTPADSAFVTLSHYEAEAGDLAQRYDPAQTNPNHRYEDRIEPWVNLGYHHHWGPGGHTLFLASYLDARMTLTNPAQPTLLAFRSGEEWMALRPMGMEEALRFAPAVGSVEAQQILQGPRWHTILGGRFQSGEFESANDQTVPFNSDFAMLFDPDAPAAAQDFDSTMTAWSLYAYQSLRVLEPLELVAGVTYKNLAYPENFLYAPLSEATERRDLVAPKAGLIWTPAARTTVRAAYSSSLSGADLDTSLSIEPTQVAGFTQAFRSLIPESVVSAQPGMHLQTVGVSFEQALPSGTYFGLGAELLYSDGDRSIGGFDGFPPEPAMLAIPMQFNERLDYEERVLTASVNQLIGDLLAVGVRYRLTDSRLDTDLTEVPDDVFTAGYAPQRSEESLLHQIGLDAIFNHSCGAFARCEALWNLQTHDQDLEDLPDDESCQLNLLVGYRFARRRVEATLGVLNLLDQDYRLNPLTPYAEMPRERTLVVRLRINL